MTGDKFKDVNWVVARIAHHISEAPMTRSGKEKAKAALRYAIQRMNDEARQSQPETEER